MRYAAICAFLLLLITNCAAHADDAQPPNFIVILCDNLGYGDVGCYGSELHRTPNIDRLAEEGLRLTDFYVTSGVCTPSRASLMTGCYPRRVNMHESDLGGSVLRPIASKGLNPDELTIAELLKDQGYATTIIGKWHLGDQREFLPTRQGFDHYLGIPYSDDMTQRPNQPWPPLPLVRDETVIEAPVDCDKLTGRYTEEALRFISEHKDGPFFLLLSHVSPGSRREPPVGTAFRGRSANGAWGDSVEEIDWSTGRILDFLDDQDLDDNTLIVWMSDNGAPRRNPPQGSNAPLAGWGYTTAEGGMRVPCLVRWPKHVPAARESSELATSMDLLPTFVKLAGGGMLDDRRIDGRDIWPILAGEAHARSPHAAFYYYHLGDLQAVRAGHWKLYLPGAPSPRDESQKVAADAPALYDLKADLGETHDLAAEHPEVIRRLSELAVVARNDLGDGERLGKHQRAAGYVEQAAPLVLPKGKQPTRPSRP